MRVVQTAGFYFPDSIGGTEVYVNALSKELRDQGVHCAIAAPRSSADGAASRYNDEGTEVFRYPFPARPSRAETQGRVPHRYFDVFRSWLGEQRADVYHQHSWTTGCGNWHLRSARELGLKTVLTLHLPNTICMRGTMLYQGRVACDGKIVTERCAACWLDSKGMPPRLARSFAHLPVGLSPIKQVPGIGPALAARGLASERRSMLEEIVATADRIVAVCGWLHEALLANGVPPTKLLLNRQGVASTTARDAPPKRARSSGVMRLGFLGRWDPVKGVHVLIDAFKRLPRTAPLELHVLGTAAGLENQLYRDAVFALAVDDSRIQFAPEAATSTTDFLSAIDVLLVPSQWMETGPLVVLEAFSHGVPVIGSDLGGIKELVTHDKDGLLVAHADVGAWAAAMQRLSNDGSLVDRLQAGIGSVRTMGDATTDMAAIYSDLFGERTNAA